MTAAMDWRDVRKGTRAGVSEKQARVDLALGDFILGMLDTLLAQVQDRMSVPESGYSAAFITRAYWDECS